MDIMGMMKKAQEVQAKLQEAQEELGRLEVEGQSGGGMVSLTLTAKGELKGVRIDASLMTPADKEMLEDLIIAAFSDGKAKADTRDQPQNKRDTDTKYCITLMQQDEETERNCFRQRPYA